MVSKRSRSGWSTHGHSAADVNIYASDRQVVAGRLSGNVENTEVGVFLREYLGVDVRGVTEELRKSGTKGSLGSAMEGLREEKLYYEWMGQSPQDGERLDGQSHLDQENKDHTADHRVMMERRGGGAGDFDCGCGILH